MASPSSLKPGSISAVSPSLSCQCLSQAGYEKTLNITDRTPLATFIFGGTEFALKRTGASPAVLRRSDNKTAVPSNSSLALRGWIGYDKFGFQKRRIVCERQQ